MSTEGTLSDLIEYFKLNAVYNTDTKSTREETPDRTQFRRQDTIVKEWKRSTKRFGHGRSTTMRREWQELKESLKGTLTTRVSQDQSY